MVVFMIDNEFKKVGLLPHNVPIYRKVKSAFDSGEQIVGVIQATGTGKTYLGLQLSLDNKNSKIVYIVPSNAIIEHIENIINSNPNLDRKIDFPSQSIYTWRCFLWKTSLKNW